MMQGKISGAVVDDQSGEPVASATVGVWSKRDSSLVTGAITEADGTFAIEGLRGGRFYVQVSFVGFVTQTIDDIALGADTATADLGTIRLAPDTQMLDEVEVSADREFIEIGVDRTVYNVKDQLVSLGGSASNVLENIPSVEVDIDGNVSLRGNQNVAILINGRPAPMQGQALASFLQGLPADAVDRVEVIPNPSAKYEPDGMAGLLNIVLTQNRDLGLGGSLSLSAATQQNYNASATLTYQKGKVNLMTSYGFRYGTRDVDGTRFFENRINTPLTFLNQDSFDERDGISHNLNTSFDYRLSDQNTLTASAMLSHRGSNTSGLTAYAERADDQTLTARYDRLSVGDGTDFSMDYRLGLRRVVDPGKHEFIAELRYEQDRDDEFDRFTQQVFEPFDAPTGVVVEQQTNEQDETSNETSLQIDYVRPFGGEGKLEAGYKGSLEHLGSDFYAETFDPLTARWMPDPNFINTFSYDLQIHAAYGILAQQWGKIGVQAGVRLEQALTDFTLETTDEAFENNYFSVFPSAFVTYKLTDTRTAKLSYSKRINRPRTRGWFNQLNPFDTNDDPLFRRVGNPYLKPEYVHAFEASLSQFTEKTSLTLTPYFRRTVDVIRWRDTVDDAGVTTTTFENFDTSDSWGAEIIGTLRLGQRFNAYASFNAYKIVTDGSNVDSDLSNDAFGFSTRANATINVREGLDLQLSHFYSSPIDIENGHISARQMSSLALRQKLLNDKASLSLNVRDIFNTMGFSLWREDARFYTEFERDWQSQSIGLTFTYNFGQARRDRRRDRGDYEGGESRPDDIEMGM